MSSRFRVGILGATGTVGQRFIQMLERHPEFEVTAVAASDRSEGKTYADACSWRLVGEMPTAVGKLRVEAPRPPLDCDLIFSSLPAEMAQSVEEEFASTGYPVISNSSACRMQKDVPLLISEVNHEHLRLIGVQRTTRGFRPGGFIVTNPNCSTVMLALALAALHKLFGVTAVVATTMQALSGAGYPGGRESLKILGRIDANEIGPADFPVSAQCHRVNVSDGHMGAVRVMLARPARLEEIREAFASFTSLPQELRLHTAPERPLIVRDEPDRPQPRLDRDAGGGMSVTVGRIKPDRLLDYRFVARSHNPIRGAAGAAILNAELLAAKSYLESPRSRTT